jgi:[acyl-carrier-protein] S-malonyltransferase
VVVDRPAPFGTRTLLTPVDADNVAVTVAPVSLGRALNPTALGLFPGQGAVRAGAGAPWPGCSAWRLVDEISGAVDVDVAGLLLHTPDDELVRTDRAQLATFALALVGWTDRCERHDPPRLLAGHSLGEITALTAAGVLTVPDAARIVATRGTAMATAAARHPGSMVALMGPSDGAREILAQLPDVWIANDNGPGQLVVSGTPSALDGLVRRSRELGWKRATALSVGGAFHSPLMADAQAALDEVLAGVTFGPTEHHVAANVDGRWHAGGDEWRARLSAQMTSPVLFSDIVESADPSVDSAVEFPPAGVLIGLVKRLRSFESLVAISEPGGAA